MRRLLGEEQQSSVPRALAEYMCWSLTSDTGYAQGMMTDKRERGPCARTAVREEDKPSEVGC